MPHSHNMSVAPDTAADLAATGAMITERIGTFLPPPTGPAHRLLQAMHYSTCGGKRVRAFITINAAGTFGLAEEAVLPAAVAIEFIHAASLIHDDMPCIDDSALRRGVASCHERFDEHTALLAGDALIIRAFELMAQLRCKVDDREALLRAIAELGEAIGALGLIGGEAVDIEAEQQPPNPDMLRFIHTNKTAKLIIASARTGAILAAAPEDGLATITSYAQHLGLLFQITDDILDATGSDEQLGKPAGADAASHKMTYPALLGLKGARDRADQEAELAIEAARCLPARNGLWTDLVELVLDREQ